MRLLLPSVLLMLAGCPGPPTEQTCERGLVDATGNVNGGFGGGPAAANEPPIALVGSPITVVVFAPLSSCISDTLRADVTLSDADNESVTAEATEATRTVSGAVRVSVTFTPQGPGVHTLRVAFEPSLGARSRLIDVAVDGVLGATTRVPHPSLTDCANEGLWPLTDDTVACEERVNGVISLSSADGGQVRFPGGKLVVVDDVLWTINGATSSLERRVVDDGGVRLTHSFPDFQSIDTPAMHDVDLALRYRSNGRLTLVRVSAQGETVRELNVNVARAYFAEDDDRPFLWSDQSCFSGCISLPDVVGLEPGFVWRGPRPGFEQPRLSGFARPTTESQSTPRFTLQYTAQTPNAPTAAFERLPLWLRSQVGTKQLLISSGRASLSFSAWPRFEVLRVGRHHVLLTDAEPGMLRVVRTQPP